MALLNFNVTLTKRMCEDWKNAHAYHSSKNGGMSEPLTYCTIRFLPQIKIKADLAAKSKQKTVFHLQKFKKQLLRNVSCHAKWRILFSWIQLDSVDRSEAIGEDERLQFFIRTLWTLIECVSIQCPPKSCANWARPHRKKNTGQARSEKEECFKNKSGTTEVEDIANTKVSCYFFIIENNLFRNSFSLFKW